MPCTDPDNILSEVTFKHRKFKLPAKGRGPIGPPNLEAMILSNEFDLLNRTSLQVKSEQWKV